MTRYKPIQVVDIFAGPGGLGEGFSSFMDRGARRFEIALSIEKDSFARKTLLLRSFFRKLSPTKKKTIYKTPCLYHIGIAKNRRGSVMLDEVFHPADFYLLDLI